MEVELQKAAHWLAKHDPILAPIIASSPPPQLVPHTNYYQALVSSIISQQLSVKAAATILQRFIELFDGAFPSPSQILSANIDTLRLAGLSRSKATYIQDLARHIIDGSLELDAITQLSNEEIVKELTAVKGIGVWTAHMFLMFCMGRLDILPVGDLGIRSGMRQLYGLENLPTPDDMTAIAARYHWSPYESAACWYIWHSLDNTPK
ncbi:MAG TPA: DNA-3-methyladenine glycosylase [Candidatus Saccharimonadales bacterium]